MIRALAALLLASFVYGCGVKSDLEIPNGSLPQQREENDPSRPPQPLGQ